MKNLSPEFKVGIFAIVVMIILSYMAFKVSGLPFTWKKGYRLYVVFDDISGLDERSRVKIAGVDSGVVEKIRLRDGRAEVTLLIEPDVKIYRNAKASLKTTGLLGEKYLSLNTGTPDEPLLKDGDTIVNTEPAADVDVLANNITEAAAYLKELTVTIEEMFGDSERQAMIETIHNLKAITENLNTILREDRALLQKVLAGLEDFSEALGNKGPALVDDLSRAAKELKRVIEENRETLKSSMENIRSASESANDIARRLTRGEGTLGKLLTDEELYDSLNRITDKAEKMLDVINNFKTSMDFHSEYNTREGEWKGYFDLTLQPSKDRYYILGVVIDPKGSVRTRETSTGDTTIREEVVEEEIEFTAMFAKRFDALALRAGIKESSFGLGADYFFATDKGRVSLDLWDINAHEAWAKRAHVKIGVNYNLFKNLFIDGGVDNLLNENRRGVYVGGGLRFESSDLQYLFGR